MSHNPVSMLPTWRTRMAGKTKTMNAMWAARSSNSHNTTPHALKTDG